MAGGLDWGPSKEKTAMKRLVTIALWVLCLALPIGVLGACKSADGGTADMVLCSDCGVEKGTEGCCDADAERCSSCGKIKGSPGCCE